jgi:glutaredoxin
MSEYILGYILKGCPYSMMANEILKNNPKNQLVYVDYNEKNKYKQLNNMKTFPQIFYVKNNIKYKIGGYDDLSSLLNKQKLADRKELHKYVCSDVPYRTFLNMLLYLNK